MGRGEKNLVQIQVQLLGIQSPAIDICMSQSIY